MARKPKVPKTDNSTELKNKEHVERIVKGFRSFFDVTEQLRRRIKEDTDFMAGGFKQWANDDIDELQADKRPILSLNLIHQTINFICGMQTERETDYRYFPRGTEDEQLGRILSAQAKYIMDRGGQHEEETQFRLGVIGGPSILEIAHSFDYTEDLLEGDVTLTSLNLNTWYCDPMARRYDKCDGRWQGKLMWYNSDQAVKQWPKSEARLRGMYDWLPFDPLTTGVPEHLLRELYDKETDRIRILQHWYKVPVTATLLVNKAEMDPAKAVMRMKDGKDAEAYIQAQADRAGFAAASQYQVVQTDTMHTLVNKQTGGMMPLADPEEGMQFIDRVKKDAGSQAASQFDIVSREATTLRVSHLTGWELLDDKPSPYDDGWRYPFSPFFCFHDADNFDDIKGIVRDLKDPQRELNWHHSTIVDTLARAPKGATWLDVASNPDIQDLKKRLPRAGFIGTYAGAVPQYWPPGSFSPGDLAMMELSSDFIGRISGADNLQANPQQKTVSGRAVANRFQGGVIGLGSVMSRWKRTKEYTGALIAKRIQQFHSAEKMDRILGQEARMQQAAGIPMQMMVPPQLMYEQFKKVQDLDYDVVVGFQDSSATFRQAQLAQLMQFAAMGIPVPPGLMIEASDVPYKEEIKMAIQKQGMGQPNEALAKVLSAGQGQGVTGVNTTA